MPRKITNNDADHFLGIDGGGTKTECLLSDADGRILARAISGPSNPLRTGYARAWFSLSEAADLVLAKQKLRAAQVRGVCAGLGGAGRSGVARRVTTFFQRSYPNAQVRVTTDLEIALEAAFGTGEGIILLAGTGSAAFGRDSNGRTARAGGRGPWIGDEGSAFDIGRRGIASAIRAEEHRGAATALSKRLLKWLQCRDWESLLEQIAKNPNEVFPKSFPLVAELADAGDAVARDILAGAATALAELVACVANELGWRDRNFSIARIGGVNGRSKFFDDAIAAELNRVAPRGHLTAMRASPAEAAVQMAIRVGRTKGNAA